MSEQNNDAIGPTPEHVAIAHNFHASRENLDKAMDNFNDAMRDWRLAAQTDSPPNFLDWLAKRAYSSALELDFATAERNKVFRELKPTKLPTDDGAPGW